MMDQVVVPQLLRAGLIGAGIQFSSSPAIHMDEARAQGRDCRYELFDLEHVAGGAQALAAQLEQAERHGLCGVNVTYPCKQAVVPLLHELSPDAAALNSVNTVLFRNGRRIGHNTDWWGFAESFRRGLPEANLQNVTLIGAGGAGVAVGYAALTLGVRQLTVFDADQSRAAELAQRLAKLFPDRGTSAANNVEAALLGANGIIHATPTGMQKFPGMPVPADALLASMWVAEIVYVPLVTELLQTARQHGCRTLDGSSMAVYQAAKAFELFFDITPDTERMQRRFTSKLSAA